MKAIRRLISGMVLLLCLVASARESAATPVTGHPRLWVTSGDLPRLRRWAADSRNIVYREGMAEALQRANAYYDARFYPGGLPNPVWPDQGTNGYVQYPSEAFAEFFAFMSLIDPNEPARRLHAARARNLLMYAIDEAAKGPLSRAPFRDVAFATADRSRWWGEGFPLVVDWIYDAVDARGARILTAEDKARIRRVFLRWAADNVRATTTSGEHPQPVGVANDPALLRDPAKLRWSVNNYYIGHMRQVTLMSLSMDAADDPPLDPALPATALGNTLRSYIGNATGAWLYQQYAMLETPETVAARLGVAPDGLGGASGGMPAEGFLYGVNLASLHQSLLALHTAGYHDVALSGPQIGLLDSAYWDKLTAGFLHSIAPTPVVYPTLSYLGPVYEAANYGDTMRLWVEPRFADLFGSLGAYDVLTGNAARLQKSRWIIANVMEGGAAKLAYRTSRSWGTPSPSRAILTFMVFDPAEPLPADPRPAMPTVHVARAPGRGRVSARTDWTPNARWFTFRCGWIQIDHQLGDCNQVELYRKGEWLTKEHSSYSGNMIGATTDYHNTLSVQNDVPSGLAWFETEISARGSQWMVGGSAGDPEVRISHGDGYVFAEGVATNLYNTRVNPWVAADNARDVAHVSRSAVWLEPDHLILYDRARSNTGRRFKRFNLTLTGAPRIAGNTAGVTTPRGQSLFIQTLLPAGASLSARPVEDVASRAEMEPTTHRLTVEDPARPADVRFLHVLEGADAGVAMAPAALLASDVGAFQGALVAGAAVFFRADLADRSDALSYTVPVWTDRHVITGLTPGAAYDVAIDLEAATLRVTVAPGTAYEADEAGALWIDER